MVAEHTARYERWSSQHVGSLRGWVVTCSCGWSKRIVGTKAEAQSTFNSHRRPGDG